MISSVGDKWNYHTLLVSKQNGATILEHSLAVSYKVKHTLAYNSTIPLLDIYPTEMKTCSKTDTWIGALHIIFPQSENNPNIHLLLYG